jgi:hypothetical protein
VAEEGLEVVEVPPWDNYLSLGMVWPWRTNIIFEVCHDVEKVGKHQLKDWGFPVYNGQECGWK